MAWRRCFLQLLLPLAWLWFDGVSAAYEVAVLGDSNFKSTVEGSESNWLLEFYAPWCGHCKRLNPVLDELAPLLGEKLRIGKVDATVHKRVANEHKIQAYPTLKFKRKGQAQLLEYDGSRSKEGLIAFANRLDAPSPQVITSASELNALKAENEVVFLLVVPPGGERPAIQDAFNTIAENNKHWLAFAVATSDVVKDEFSAPAPFIAKLEEDEEPHLYEGPLTASAATQLDKWIQANSLPLLTPYAGHNFRRLGESGKLLFIAVVDPSAQEKTEAFMASVREVGRSQRELVSKHFVLGYLDGVKWDGFVRQFNIEQRQLPRFFILDYAKQSFYEDVEVDEVDEIEHYLIDVAAGKVPAQRQGAMQATRRAWQRLKDWYPYSLVLLLPVLLLLSTCICPSYWGDGKDDDEDADAGEGRDAQGYRKKATPADGDGEGEQEEDEPTLQQKKKDD